MVRKLIMNMLKGVGVGASMLIPGVSGGTMAIILDIYDELISGVSSFFKDIKKNLFILSTFALGGIIGIFLFSKAILYVTTTYRMPMMFLFLGAIMGSVPMLYKKANIKKPAVYHFTYPAIGFLLVLLMALIPKNLFKFDVNNNVFSIVMLIVAGIICAIALVLPGISVSYMLLLFGMYEPTMKAIQDLNIIYLIPLMIGGIVGVCGSAKVIESAMEKHTQATYMIIIGFLLGSILDVFPGVPIGIEWVICPITFCIGFSTIFFLSKKTAH